jgi:hypothetical protein
MRLDPFDRYGMRHKWNPLTLSDGTGEYPLIQGRGWFDVYNTNKWKGDEPIAGEHTFFAAEVILNTLGEFRQKAGAEDADEIRSTAFASAEVFHGDTVFRPPTWRVRTTLAFDIRDADDVDLGETQGDIAVQELFGEALLWELDPYLDFGSIRVGRQAFASDFRNFIFVDQNDGAQLFGSFFESRVDWQVAFFDLVAKDPFSNLNRGFEQRNQQFFAANVFLEDWPFMGYKLQGTLQWAHDTNGEVTLLDASTATRTVDAYYLGFNGDGRIGKVEVAHALYWMFGEDDGNPFAAADPDTFNGEPLGQTISAQMAALEITVPDDWRRYVFSAMYASGDSDPTDDTANGFDSVFDNPIFAGGAGGFFHRQAIAGQFNDGAGGVNNVGVVNTNSLYPNLRTKANDGPNGVNPGLILLHTGVEATLSNYWAAAANVSYLMFADTAVLEQINNGNSVDPGIGLDVSVNAQWRPFGVDNLIVTPGLQALFLTGDFTEEDALFGAFVQATIIL